MANGSSLKLLRNGLKKADFLHLTGQGSQGGRWRQSAYRKKMHAIRQ
jgi:hypothetical protein